MKKNIDMTWSLGLYFGLEGVYVVGVSNWTRVLGANYTD